MKRYLVNNRYTSGTTDKTLATYPLVLCLLMSWSFGHLNQSRSTINMIHSPFPLLISRAFDMVNHCFIKNNITSTGLKLTQSQNPQPSTQIVSGSGTSFAFDSWLLNLFKATLHVNQVPQQSVHHTIKTKLLLCTVLLCVVKTYVLMSSLTPKRGTRLTLDQAI